MKGPLDALDGPANLLQRRSMRAAFLFAMFLVSSVSAAAQPVVLEPGYDRVKLGHYLEIFEDKSGQVPFSEIVSGAANSQFKASSEETPGYGISNSAFWVRFRIKNPGTANHPLLLEVDQPQFDDVKIFLPGEGKAPYVEKQTGDQYPLATRDVKHWNFVFRLTVPAGTEQTIFLRLRMNGPTAIPLTLWEPESFQQNAIMTICFFGMFIGLMSVMAIYNTFLFFSFRDLAYLYYVALTGFLILVLCTFSGLDGRYLWTDSPVLGEYIHHWGVVGGILTGTLFVTRVLETRRYMPFFHRILKIFGIACLPALLLPFFVPFIIAIPINVAMGVVGLGFYLFAGAWGFYKGVRAARFYLLAQTGLLLAFLVAILQVTNVIPDNIFTRYAFQIGGAVQAVLFSFALTDKVNILKQEREDALAEKLIETEKVASLSKAFERFVPKQFLEFLEKESVAAIRLGDNTQRTMSILFCDIRSFTDISEAMSPDDNFRFINEYLGRVGPFIRSHGGFIDKFIGDAIMALFPSSVADAIDSAISIQQEVRRFNEVRVERGDAPIRIGIGIHTGNLMLGTVGEESRMDGTVISDAVNLASRIEGLTKSFGASIIVSEVSFKVLPNAEKYEQRLLGRLKVKGKKVAVSMIEIIDVESDPDAHLKLLTKPNFEKGIELYQTGNYAAAASEFRTTLASFKIDKASAVYLSRCVKQLESELEAESKT